MRLSVASGMVMALVCAGCSLSVGTSLSACIADADKTMAAAPPLPASASDSVSGRRTQDAERAAIKAGMGRRDDLARACMQARGFTYDAEGYSRNRPPDSKRAVDYLDGRYWRRG